MRGIDWTPFLLSLQLAAVTTAILAVLGTMLVYFLHFYSFRLKPLFKALVSLPLVLPPTVLGYYLLLAFQPNSWIGYFSEQIIGIPLIFSFGGLVLGSVIFSLPFMVNPILSAVESLPEVYTEAAFTLGKSRWITFTRVLLPNAWGSILVGLVMTFAHTIGEFGVILMIGGNLPGRTRVASIAIYNEVEAMNYANADRYAMALMGISLVLLLLVYFLQPQRRTYL